MELLVAVSVALLALFLILGLKVGLVRRLLEFLGLVGSFFLASGVSPAVGRALSGGTDLSLKVAAIIAWVVLFLAGLLLTRWLAGLISKIVRISVLGWIDRIGGALFGLLIGAVLCSVLLLGATQLPGGEKVHEHFTARAPTRLIYEAAPRLYRLFRSMGGDEREVLQQVLDVSRDRLTASLPGSGDSRG